MTKYCQGKDKAFQYQLWYIINGTAVPANWYWSISQLVLEYQPIGTGVSANWYCSVNYLVRKLLRNRNVG